jgi:cytochrome c-type biogenesis protein CcmH/NrfG
MTDAEERYQEGRRLATEGDLAGAFQAFENAVELDPNHAAVCIELAKLSLLANEKRAFTNWLHEAMRLAELDPEPHLLMAEVLAESGRYDEAAEELHIARKLSVFLPDQVKRAEALADRIRPACRPNASKPD